MTIDCLLHAHSTYSYDSPTDLSEIAALAGREGFRCVLMSEHNNTLDHARMAHFVARCDEVSNEQVLVIPGLELSFAGNRVHLLAYGVRVFIDSLRPETTFRDLVARIRDAGGVAVLAHPSHDKAYSLVQRDDLLLLDGIEVWNARSGSRFCPHAHELRWLRELRRARPLAAFAGVDLHSITRYARLGVRVNVDALSAAAVLGALRNGRFRLVGRYVDIDASLEDAHVWVDAMARLGLAAIGARKLAYRLEARLESLGIRVPASLTRLARRAFWGA